MNTKQWPVLSSDNEELRERALSEPLRARKSWRYRIVGDLFAKLPFDQIAAVLGVVAASSRHEFEVVTLCPERAGEWFRWFKQAAEFHAIGCDCSDEEGRLRTLQDFGARAAGVDDSLDPTPWLIINACPWPLPNLRLTTHVTTQAEADARIPALLACPAASYGLTMTPTEGIDIRPWLSDDDGCEDCDDNGIGGPGHCRRSDIPRCEQCPTKFAVFENDERGTRKTLALVTVQPAPDPVHPGWVRSIRDQCKAAGVPFRFEGWGRWLPVEQMTDEQYAAIDAHGALLVDHGRYPWGEAAPGIRVYPMKPGHSGRLLDGVTHDGEVSP